MNLETHSSPFAGGFSLVETMMAVLTVSVAALLLVQASRNHATTRAQSLARASAVRLGTEFAEWTRRGGHHALDMPLARALSYSSPARADCYSPAPSCDRQQAAWHYLRGWQARLREAIADGEFIICNDRPPERGTLGWACDAAGLTQVLKIRRSTWRSSSQPLITIDLGVAP